MRTTTLATNCKNLLLATSLLMGAVLMGTMTLPAVAADGYILDFNTNLQQAQQGDAGAQLILGVMYESGKGVRQDYSEAVNWYRKAADQGLAVAQYNLALIYDSGKEGVSQDDAEAVKWFSKAADQGLAVAQFSLGMIYATGEGVRQNTAIAKEWLGKACDNGYQDGCDVYKVLKMGQ